MVEKHVFTLLTTGFDKSLVRHDGILWYSHGGYIDLVSIFEPTESLKLLPTGSSGSKKI